jgi:CheY-like chemotaxis protein
VKVLVIDDQPLIRDLLAEFLEALGHEAVLAADGHEGLARFDPLVHRVVLTDFRMPGNNGPRGGRGHPDIGLHDPDRDD